MITTVFTDGACQGNPGPGGWAWLVPSGPFASGYQADTTNNRMEMTAVLEAIVANPGELHIVSDSQYVVKCFEQRWYVKWESNGWKGSRREPVSNQDLWEQLLSAYRERGGISFEWIKGHSGNKHNDIVDRLAVEAIDSQAGRSGRKPPESLLEKPDEPVKGFRLSNGIPARYAGACPTCKVGYEIGTLITRNAAGRWVHAGGCPKK